MLLVVRQRETTWAIIGQGGQSVILCLGAKKKPCCQLQLAKSAIQTYQTFKSNQAPSRKENAISIFLSQSQGSLRKVRTGRRR
eukprot:4343801-Pleurochrysis_carterae.AAC.1